MTREFDKRPWMKSLVHKTEVFPLDRTMHRSIMYNKVLFYTLRDYYSGYGWMMLIKYYLSFSYTLLKKFGMMDVDKYTLRSMLCYIHEEHLPYKEHEVNEKDIKWFNYAVSVLLFHFDNLKEVMKKHDEYREKQKLKPLRREI